MRQTGSLGVVFIVLCSLLRLAVGENKVLGQDLGEAKCAFNGSDNNNNTGQCTLKDVGVADTATIVELGLRNFESFMDSSTVSLVLLYDRMNKRSDEYKMARQMLELSAKQVPEVLAERFPGSSHNISFGQLDVRQHSVLRITYMEAFATKHFKKVESQSFMQGTPVIGSRFSIFFNYNVVDDLVLEHEDFEMESFNEDMDMLQAWLLKRINPIIKAKNGTEQDALKMARPSKPNLEKEQWSRLQDIDNSFPFDEYFAEEASKNSSSFPDIHDAYIPSLEDDDDEEADDGNKFFIYPALDYEGPDDLEFDDASEMLGMLLDHYLGWCECYEELWDEDRKKRADEQLNYGPLLAEMNKKVKGLLLKGKVPKDPDLDLRRYFSDMVFGYGRSPKTLERYVEAEIFEKSGRNMSSIDDIDRHKIRLYRQVGQFVSAESEREDDDAYAKYVASIKAKLRDELGTFFIEKNKLSLFSSVYDFLYAQEEGGFTDDYDAYIFNIVVKLHDILVEFHKSITQNYVEYLKKHGKHGNGDDFAFQKPDVLSMSDPANAELLSDYEEFERRYTAVGKPVVLSNVKMFLHDDPVQFLLERCRFVDVSGKIRVSRQVGDSRNSRWGGLDSFRLPNSLRNEQRRSKEASKESKNRVTLEQFFTLYQQIDSLYLHDFSLKGECERFFYENSPYDSKQFMQIPYVLGGYDLVRKTVRSNYENSFPSVFVGKKGTNSKFHIDSGETGFFLYLVSGRKRWVTAKISERPFMYERLTKFSMIPDALAMNRSERDNMYFDEKYPLLRHSADEMGVYEFVQEPGQLVWIPPHTAHAVENLEDIVGFSINTIPRAGVYRGMHKDLREADSHNKVDAILRYLLFEQGGKDSFAERTDPLYTTLGETWAQL